MRDFKKDHINSAFLKNAFILPIALAAALTACQEFEPVFTFGYDDAENYGTSLGGNVVEAGSIVPNTTIAQLAAMYKNGSPMEITEDIIISGRVSTTDQPGNFYKSLYIQDESGAIELKLGKNSLHNEYKPGTLVYVKCGPAMDPQTGQKTLKGLYLGSYGYKSGSYGGNGMVQLGCADPSGRYETSYMELSHIINAHVFRGLPTDIKPVEPAVISESDLPSSTATPARCPYLGKLVTVKGLKYGNETFTLLYINGNESNKNSKNRVFLSDKTWGIDSWAMSKTNFLARLRSGDWDEAMIGNSGDTGYGTVGSTKLSYIQEADPVYLENLARSADYVAQVYKTVYGKPMPATADWKSEGEKLKDKWCRYCLVNNANGYSVSQYFKMGSKEIQLRTSGYSKFCDARIPQSVLDGSATVDITGILTLYQGSIQMVVNSLDDIKINE